MKRSILLIILIFGILSAFAQGNIHYYINVYDNLDKPQANMKITALERTSLRKITAITDQNGEAYLHLDNGKKWILSVGEMEKCANISAIPHKITEIQKGFLYDLEHWKRKKRQDKFRTNKGFLIIEESISENTPFAPGDCMLILRLSDLNGKTLYKQKVDVVSLEDSTVFRSETDVNGKAFFIVPNNMEYDIDVNEFKNYNFCDFGDVYTKYMLDLQYAPTVVNEMIINDTIRQIVTERDRASSERSLIKIAITGGKKNGRDETVFLRELQSGKVYTTKTNNAAYAYFLIPSGYIYMVDFNFQKDADAVNLLDTEDISVGEYHVHYSPDPKLEYPERYIPTPDNLYIRSFNTFLKKQYEKPKKEALKVRIFSMRKINKNSREALFMLTLTGAEPEGNDFRLPLNISLVLDKSGSMYSSGRSQSIKKALWAIGSSFVPGDIVSMVLFDTEANSVKHISENYMDEIEEVIENYEPSGGTNIFKGIKTGVTDIKQNYNHNKANRVIILTDGYGTTPPKEITDYAEQKYNEGIEFSTIGMGTDYNRSLLELIARKGNGSFKQVGESDLLTEVFLKQIDNSFRYLVKDLKIEIFHDKELIYSKLFGYPVKSTDNNTVSFEIGKLPYNANQIAYLKFKLKKPKPEIENKPLKMKVSYFDPIKKTTTEFEEEISLKWTDETETEFLIDQEEKTLYAIAILNQSLKTMAEAYASGDIESAKLHLKEGKKQTNEIFPDAKPKEVRTLFNDVDKYLKLFYRIEKNEED